MHVKKMDQQTGHTNHKNTCFASSMCEYLFEKAHCLLGHINEDDVHKISKYLGYRIKIEKRSKGSALQHWK